MDDFNSNPLYNDPSQQVHNAIGGKSSYIEPADPLALEIDDSELEKNVTARIKASKKFFEDKYNLSARRQKTEKYLFGRQVQQLENDGKLKDYETRSSDNVLYEIEGSIKALATSKIPDIIITPGGDDKEREQSAKDLSTVVDNMNKKRELREVLGLGFKHLPVYFTAVLKAIWDSEMGKDGDYRFVNIHPEYIVVDHTCTTRNPDDMSFIAQLTPMTVQEVLMKFPKKKQAFLEAAKLPSTLAGELPDDKELASEVKVWEVWFDWYKKKGGAGQQLGQEEMVNKQEMEKLSILEPGITWERVSGVLWKFEKVILEKMLDPNYDHKGETKLVSYADPSDETTKQEIDPQQLVIGQLLGQTPPNMQQEQVYYNYFDRPHKPFYFYGYDQWGKVYLDETSRIEQNIRNQENLDDQNRTILDQVKKRVKHIWSKDSGLTTADVQRMDMDNPKLDAMVEGDPNIVHKSVDPERPDSAQFNALNDTRSRMYAISHTTAIRGNLQSDVATSNQIGREGDFSVTDDLSDATTTAACEWVSGWQLQFIKLRYTKDHMRQILGEKGVTTYIRVRRDMVFDGMEVVTKASSTDKLKAQRNAMQAAQLGAPFTNPLDFFKDMDSNDAEGRTERGMMFATDPAGYIVKYVMKMDTAQQMAAGIGQPQPGMPQPMTGGQPGAAPAQPMNPTPTDTRAVAATPPPLPQASPRGL